MGKSLHGHAVIELTDVKTGKKEVVEHDNLVTNAVAKAIDIWSRIIGANSVNKIYPLDKAFSGLYLFNSALEENVNNMFLPNPSDAALTGYAGNEQGNGQDNMRGDYNSTESGPITNGYKYVWDFGTDDANGEIACISLTHAIAGFHGYHYSPLDAIWGNKTANGNLVCEYYDGGNHYNYKGLEYRAVCDSSGNNYATWQLPLFTLNANARFRPTIEITNDEIIFTVIYATSASSKDILNIIKYAMRYNNIDMSHKLNELYVKEQETFELIQASAHGLTSFHFFDDGTYYHGIYLSSNIGQHITVDKVTHNVISWVNNINTFNSIGKYARDTGVVSGTGQSSNAGRMTGIYRNGYYYFFVTDANQSSYNGSASYVAKMNVTTNEISLVTPVINIANRYNYSYQFMYLGNHNEIVTSGYTIDTDDNIHEGLCGWQGSNTSYGNNPAISVKDFIFACFIGGYGASGLSQTTLLPNLQYLATINNLDTPVEKTAAKTMKITYTLTYAE